MEFLKDVKIKTILCCWRNNNRPLTIFRSYKICNLSKPQKLNKNSPPETILFYLQYHCCVVMRLTHVRCQDNIYTHILRYSWKLSSWQVWFLSSWSWTTFWHDSCLFCFYVCTNFAGNSCGWIWFVILMFEEMKWRWIIFSWEYK